MNSQPDSKDAPHSFLSLKMPNESDDLNCEGKPFDSIQHAGRIVIVGPNGSGKTRLGAWFENPANVMGVAGAGPSHGRSSMRAFRIGAQRVLTFPDRAERKGYQDAAAQLSEGDANSQLSLSRVKGDPVTGQNQDFPVLLNALFADRAEKDRLYRERGASTNGSPGVPDEDVIVRVRRVWEEIFSERSLSVEDHAVFATTRNGTGRYPAGKMSDGERVGFYLIASVLLANTGAVLVIDEPELHLHPSIQSSLWNALEFERSDCVFVYITHDLAFAASRAGTAKILLYDYVGPGAGIGDVGRWIWKQIPPNADLPEDLVLKIAGARRPALFVEGTNGKWDHRVYEALYPEFYIIPSQGADLVQKSVSSFTHQSHLHRYEPQGIIDRDDRAQQEIEGLRTKRIHVLPVAAIENMLVLPECLKAFAESQPHLDNDARQEAINSAKKRVIDGLRKRREETISERAQYAVRRRLHHVAPPGFSRKDLVEAVNTAVREANAEANYDAASQLVDAALAAPLEEGYLKALQIDNNKAVLSEAAEGFRSQSERFGDAIVKLICKDEALRTALRAMLTVTVPEQRRFGLQTGSP